MVGGLLDLGREDGGLKEVGEETKNIRPVVLLILIAKEG